VKSRVSPETPYAIGLRLSNRAVTELSDPAKLGAFKQWLDEHGSYVFTINGFPYGAFHGVRVKEQVYLPDWSSQERVIYTRRLADLLVQLVPEGTDGSVSTVPLGFKPLVTTTRQRQAMRSNLWDMIEHLDALEKRTGRYVHLGLEPEPGCVLENTEETVAFFRELRAERPSDERWQRFLGVNYDACHFAVEFESAKDALDRFKAEGIKLSKLHLSSALKVRATAAAREALKRFTEPVYFHQTLVQRSDGVKAQYADLDEALAQEPITTEAEAGEWRIHFHVPLHSPPTKLFDTTADHLVEALDWLAVNPKACAHLEMETYTWEVLPLALKSRDVVEQLAAEYEWTLGQLRKRSLA
jgi:sugar phosphate isomerase/epimerase